MIIQWVYTCVQVKHRLYILYMCASESQTLYSQNWALYTSSSKFQVTHVHLYDIAAKMQTCRQTTPELLAILQTSWYVTIYGTHYITSVDAGAIIAQMDFIDSAYVAQSSWPTKEQ